MKFNLVNSSQINRRKDSGNDDQFNGSYPYFCLHTLRIITDGFGFTNVIIEYLHLLENPD